MNVRTNTKAGSLSMNRSEAFAVKTGVKAGGPPPGLFMNRSEAFRRIR